MENRKEKKQDCIFCKIIAGEIKQDIIYSDDNFVVMPDKFPVADGHCLIIPRKHYATILDMPSTLGTELLGIVKAQSLRLIGEKKADGIKLVNNNFEAGGQIVPHFHLHIIPEKKGIKRTSHV